MRNKPSDTSLNWLTYFRNTLADGERVEIEPEDQYTLLLDESALDIRQGRIAQSDALRLIATEERYRQKTAQAKASLRCVNKTGHETILILCTYENKKQQQKASSLRCSIQV